MDMIIFENGRFYQNGKFSNPESMLVCEGRIVQIGEGIHVSDAEREDLGGRRVIPGLIDLHIHGMGGTDTLVDPDAARKMSALLPRYGVTGFLPTVAAGSVPVMRTAVEQVARAMERPEGPGARILGIYLEGPFLNPVRAGALDKDALLIPSIEEYEHIAGTNEDKIRLVALAPEMQGAIRLAAELVRRGIIVSMAHTDATAEQARRGFENGISQATHLFNGMGPLHHRFPGAAGAALADGNIWCELICDGIHLHPDAVNLTMKCKGEDRCLLVSDAISAAGMPDGEYPLGGKAVSVRNGIARIPEGNLAGSTLTLDHAVKNAMAFSNKALKDILPMATENPAQRLGSRELGRLEAGCLADFALLDSEDGIYATFVGGKSVYQRDE